MVRYYDKNKKELYAGCMAVSERSDDYVSCGYIKRIENQLYFVHTDGYDAPNLRSLLSEMDLSKVSIFDVETFNEGVSSYNSCFYDDNGINITEGMIIFTGYNGGGSGGPVEKQGPELFYYDYPLSETFTNRSDFCKDIVVVAIPKKYFSKKKSRKLKSIKFIDNTHEQEYKALLQRMNASNRDVYRKALAYLITADDECKKHIDNIYDFEECCIIPRCLNEGWQTGTSLKTCRLAFNLYNGGLGWCDEDDRYLVTPAELFCCSLAPFYLEAVKLRYPEYTA